MHKLETQSLHFSKAQYSLQCTVKQCSNSDSSPYQYLYHLSDVMWHNHAFTAAAVEHIIFLETLLDIVRFKSDNCATQYKSKYAFFLVFFGKKSVEKSDCILWCFGTQQRPCWCHDCLWGKEPNSKSSLDWKKFDTRKLFLVDKNKIDVCQSQKKFKEISQQTQITVVIPYQCLLFKQKLWWPWAST